ncbi:MAG TPA: adenosyl-hopene transferase HpnH [Bryobacteraceae bacterium]|nr:adenosyl-hopene transferase HpnH [Bryobacteraceae bacterium]
MKFPLSMTAGMASYIVKNKLRPRPEWQVNNAVENDTSNPFKIIYTVQTGEAREPHPMIKKRFPIVLMLEPLHTCNLTCTGCGRIREYESTITQKLSLEQCLGAVDECGAPMVTICGGEPMLYPEIGPLVAAILERGKSCYLCTNGMFIVKRLKDFQPAEKFFFNVHLDGMEQNHDLAVERKGVFKEAIAGIQAAKAAGFKVVTNTTVYKETDMNEIEELFTYLKKFGVDGHTISPAYGYSAVNDREIFLTREDVHEKFKDFDKFQAKFPLQSTPVYVDFLQGKRELPCTAWGNPTYNVKGWKGPCYLITDAHYKTFEELMTLTPWNNYGPGGSDPRCEHCMTHCGFEPSAAYGINSRPSDPFRMLTWLLR